MIDPVSLKVVDEYKFTGNEAAFSMIMVDNFDAKRTKYLIVGAAKNFNVASNTSEIGFIYLFKLKEHGKGFEFIHKTPTETLPLSFALIGA
jgi:splicing factor 3B subunit 3